MNSCWSWERLTAWANACLGHPQQESQNQNASVVLRSDMGDHNDTPHQKHASHVLGNRQLLDKQVRWDSPEQIPKVEDGCHPGVALALEAKIRNERVRRSIVE